MRRLIALIPLALFLVFAGYLGWSLRPGYNPQALPSVMIDREARISTSLPCPATRGCRWRH